MFNFWHLFSNNFSKKTVKKIRLMRRRKSHAQRM